MTAFEKIYKLHNLLSSRKQPVSMATLETELECSRSTVNRIIEKMKNYLGAPIEYDHTRNGHFYDTIHGKKFELPGLWFNAEELYALLSAQQLLAEIQPGILDAEISPLKDRISKLIQQHIPEKTNISDRVRLIRTAHRRAEIKNFRMVASAVMEETRLIIIYHGRDRDEQHEREISPQRITHYRDNWYVDAFCHLRNGLRSFALERITEIKRTNTKSKKIAPEKVSSELESTYGIFSGKKKHTATLKFTPHRARWIAEENWHPEQKGEMLADGSYKLKLPYSDPRELILEIQKFGADVKVLAPESLRKAVVDGLKAAVEQYSGE